MHETCALWLLVPSVTIHLYNDQYTVRLSELTETTVSTLPPLGIGGGWAACPGGLGGDGNFEGRLTLWGGGGMEYEFGQYAIFQNGFAPAGAPMLKKGCFSKCFRP